MANICVIGVGYVGLSCGVCLSELGHKVVCVDIEKEKIDLLNSGETPIVEFGLKDLLNENLKKIKFWVLVFASFFLLISILIINSSIRLVLPGEHVG